MMTTYDMTLEFNGKSYPVRTVRLQFAPKDEVHEVLVSTQSLSNALEPFETVEQMGIDDQIYFYVPDKDFNLDQQALTELVAKETEAFVPRKV